MGYITKFKLLKVDKGVESIMLWEREHSKDEEQLE